MAAVIMATMVLRFDARGSIAAEVSLGQRIASIIVLGAFICGLAIIGGKSIRMSQAKNPQISGQKLTEMLARMAENRAAPIV